METFYSDTYGFEIWAYKYRMATTNYQRALIDSSCHGTSSNIFINKDSNNLYFIKFTKLSRLFHFYAILIWQCIQIIKKKKEKTERGGLELAMAKQATAFALIDDSGTHQPCTCTCGCGKSRKQVTWSMWWDLNW